MDELASEVGLKVRRIESSIGLGVVETTPPTLTVVIPTIGRRTLARTLASIRSQALLAGDEVLLVCDGDFPDSRRVWSESGLAGRMLWIDGGPSRDWGMTARTRGIEQAVGEWLLFMDDDDVYLPGAFAAIRQALFLAPRRPHLFRMRSVHARGGLIWGHREVKCGNVSTQCFGVPNDHARMGRWSPRYEGDYDFIASTLLHYAEGPVWREEVIAEWLHDCQPT